MQDYTEVKFNITPLTPWNEILMAELIEIGYDSFTEEFDGIKAYIPTALFDRAKVQDLYIFNQPEVVITFESEPMPNINWNEEWEKNFSPIVVAEKVRIRAEFHPQDTSMEEIVIQPKMSFGTGHHPTTHLMIEQMLSMDLTGKSVLDMGCGTSVLAIYAKMKGAGRTLGIDIDQWSVENSIENAKRNDVDIEIKLGTSALLGNDTFDIILANINRNILLSDIPHYEKVLNRGGQLLLSGLCFFDVDDIMEVCTAAGLTLEKKLQLEEWVSLLLRK